MTREQVSRFPVYVLSTVTLDPTFLSGCAHLAFYVSLDPKIVTNCLVSKMYTEFNLSMVYAISVTQEDRGQLWKAAAGCYCKFLMVHASKRQGANDRQGMWRVFKALGPWKPLDLDDVYMTPLLSHWGPALPLH